MVAKSPSYRLAAAIESAALLRAALPAFLAGLVLLGAFGWLLWSAGRRLDAALTAPPPEPGAFDRMTAASEPPEAKP